MSAWSIYLWTRLDGICVLLSVMIGFGIVATIPTILYAVSEDNKRALNIGIKLGLGTLLLAMIFVIIPTKKDAAMMYVVPKLAESEVLTKDCPELVKLGIEALKEQLKSLAKTKEKQNEKEIY